jgi:homoserine kinase
MKSKSIKVTAPATVSNVGPGFDIMGFAINTVVEEMTVHLSDKPGIRIKKISGENNGLPLDIKKRLLR